MVQSIDSFINKLGIKYPIIQAGMAGGITTPHLVAAVSNAGALGTLGAGYMTAEQISQAIKSIRELTDKPFAVNIFIPEEIEYDVKRVGKMKEILTPYRNKLGLPNEFPDLPPPPSFQEQMQVILEEDIKILSFTFGLLSEEWMNKLKGNGTIVMGTATTVREGIALETSGVNFIVGQGSEAGGHRGTFIGNDQNALIGTIALIPQLVDAVNLPVIAAGGLMDGRGMVAAMALGASAVQMGSAFLVSEESGAHILHKQSVLNSSEEDSVLTTAFSGKLARGILNQFISEMEPNSDLILPYPVQNLLTSELRRSAAHRNNSEYMSMWSGQASRLSNARPVGILIKEIMEQTEGIIKGLTITH